ncbi:MAG: O-antigen ligase family protein [Cyclobacteriaceae bacterium]|nr:O-antigen ligase family protein [Cyclobacteriaceae bacterium]
MPVIAFILIHFLYIGAYTSLSVVIILVVIVTLKFFIKSYAYFKLLLLAIAISFCILFYLATPYLKLYQDNYSLFGNVEYVYSQHPLFRIDNNTSWRLIFWYRTVIETFPQNLIGIGIGTPLLPYTPNISTSDLIYDDEHVAHVIGTHNTFITVFVRFGIISILLFGMIYRSVFREYFLFNRYYLNNRNDINIFLGFIALSTVGLFNLLIETSTLSALYWISLGFVSRAITNRKNQNYDMQNM